MSLQLFISFIISIYSSLLRTLSRRKISKTMAIILFYFPNFSNFQNHLEHKHTDALCLEERVEQVWIAA